jgi:hypothetical protein
MKGYGGKCNHTTNMRVKGHREANEDQVCVEFEPREKPKGKKDGMVSMDVTRSYASICMSKEEAKHYPVGSMAAIHCVPGRDSDAEETPKPKSARGRIRFAAEAAKKYRVSAEEEADED